MSCDFARLIWLLIGWFSFNSSMARMKKMPWMGEGWKALEIKTWTEVHVAPVELPALAEPPAPDLEAPHTLGETERRRVEVEKLEEVGRSTELSSTQQLFQMAAEARPSTLGGEGPARRKL